MTGKEESFIEETFKILKMPRNTRNSEKQLSTNRAMKSSQKRLVANVNKEDETRPKAKKGGPLATKGCKRTTDYNSERVEKNVAAFNAKKTTRKQAVDTTEDMNNPDLDDPNQIILNSASALIEDDQVVEMTVEDADTSYAQAEESDEEDGEITFSGGHKTIKMRKWIQVPKNLTLRSKKFPTKRKSKLWMKKCKKRFMNSTNY